jgi:hypothetical protein
MPPDGRTRTVPRPSALPDGDGIVAVCRVLLPVLGVVREPAGAQDARRGMGRFDDGRSQANAGRRNRRRDTESADPGATATIWILIGNLSGSSVWGKRSRHVKFANIGLN